MRKTTKRLAGLLAAVMLLTLVPISASAAEDGGFSDVPQNAWYARAVDYTVGHGLMNGYDNGTFSPAAILKRGMIAQVLYNWENRPWGGEGEEKPWGEPFTDVASDAWYANAVNWAKNEGVINGATDTTFAPDRQLNRQEMITIIYRFVGWKGADQSAAADLSAYPDADSVSNFAKEAMAWAVANEMLHIESDGLLKPREPVQRCELAYALMMLNWNASEADTIRLMAGSWFDGGAALEVKDCAVIIQYDFHLWDMDPEAKSPAEVQAWMTEVAKTNGYSPIGEQGTGSKVYAPALFDDGTGACAIALGEEGTFKLGVQAGEQGQTRRFAQTYNLWKVEGWSSWMVYSVEEQDYYEENGARKPCFVITLILVND